MNHKLDFLGKDTVKNAFKNGSKLTKTLYLLLKQTSCSQHFSQLSQLTVENCFSKRFNYQFQNSSSFDIRADCSWIKSKLISNKILLPKFRHTKKRNTNLQNNSISIVLLFRKTFIHWKIQNKHFQISNSQNA